MLWCYQNWPAADGEPRCVGRTAGCYLEEARSAVSVSECLTLTIIDAPDLRTRCVPSFASELRKAGGETANTILQCVVLSAEAAEEGEKLFIYIYKEEIWIGGIVDLFTGALVMTLTGTAPA